MGPAWAVSSCVWEAFYKGKRRDVLATPITNGVQENRRKGMKIKIKMHDNGAIMEGWLGVGYLPAKHT
jgi:hypothetical protein